MKSILILSSLTVALAANILSEEARQQGGLVRADVTDKNDSTVNISPEIIDPGNDKKLTVTVSQDDIVENDQLNPDGQDAVARSLIGGLLDLLLNLGSSLVGNGIKLDVGISSNGVISDNTPQAPAAAPRRAAPPPPPPPSVNHNYEYDGPNQAPPPPPRLDPRPRTPRTPRVPPRARLPSIPAGSSNDISYSVGRNGISVSKNGRPLPGVNIRPRPRGGDDDDDEDEDDDDDDDDDEDDRYDEENDLVYGGQVKAVDI